MMHTHLETARRCLLAVGALAVLILAAFPPWIVVTPALTVSDMNVPERVKLIGHQSIFYPPKPDDYSFAGDLLNDVLPKPQKDAPRDHFKSGSMLDELGVFDDDRIAKKLRMVRVDVTRWAVQCVSIVVATLLLTAATRDLPSRASP